MNLFII